MDKIIKTDAEWRKQLTPEQYTIARGKGTERAFCGVFYDNHKMGVYHCACAATCRCSPRTRSSTRARAGRASSSRLAKENITEVVDRSHGMSSHGNRCVRGAMRTSATSSTTVRGQAACAIA